MIKNIFISLMMIISCFVQSDLYAQTVLNVPGIYKNIQTALNAAREGDTVLVQPGHYYENIIWPDIHRIKLLSAGTKENTFIDGKGIDRVIQFKGRFGSFDLDSTALIQGFTILNGRLNAPGAYAFGAGIYIESASPLLKNLTIRNNLCAGEWSFGAGIYLKESNSSIEYVEVIENVIQSTIWSYGAGIYIDNSSSHVIIKNSLISKNKMESGATYYYGGGICIDGDSHVKLINSVVSLNEFVGTSGFWYYGAGVSCRGSLDISYLDLINCTIVNNFQSDGNLLKGGGVFVEDAETKIVNAIIWNNGIGSEIVNRNSSGHPPMEVSYSDVKGGWMGTGNINLDPLFISEEFYFLKPESPCLAAGTLIQAPLDDRYGNPRPSPIRSNPDMGAVEMDQDFSHILAVIFYDENQNGQFDSREHLQPDGSIVISPSKQNLFFNNKHGILAILKNGNYQIQFYPSSLPNWHLTKGISSFDVNVNTKNFADTIYFGVEPNNFSSELSTNIYSPPLRCNETIKFTVFVKNNGSRIENGILWFEVDERLQVVDFLDKPDTIIKPNIYGWFYNDLYPGEGGMKCIKIKIPGITEIPAGEILHFKSYLEDPGNSFTLKSNVFYYDTPTRCSQDPNDKLVNPMRVKNYTLLDEHLIYTIRFQNTGNDLAYRVVIRDTLDPKLDWSDLKVLNSSHPNQLVSEISDNGILTFSFENIRLPFEKLDKDGSNGFVCYSIKAIANVPEESKISNTASIYFDYNPSIRTNTTQSVMVEKIPLNTTQIKEDALGLLLYPNPACNYLKMSSKIQKPIHYILYTIEGKEITQNKFTTEGQLNLENLNSGMYFLEFRYSKVSETRKLIITK